MVASKSGASNEASDERETLAPAPGQTLQDYLSVTPAILPDPVVIWSLNLPPIPGLSDDSGLEGASGILTTEIDDSAADSGEEAEETPRRTATERIGQSSPHRRRQLKRFCDRSLSVAAEWPNLFKAFLGKLVLGGIAKDLWPDEVERAKRLVSLIKCLAHPQDQPNLEEREAISSYVAISLAILRSEVSRLSVEDEANLRFKSACVEAESFEFTLDAAAIERAGEEIKGIFGEVVSSEYVLRVAQSLTQAKSPIDSALDLIFEEEGIRAREESGVIVVEASLPDAYHGMLLRLASFVKGSASAVRAETNSGVSVACIWEDPILLITSKNDFGRRGSLFKGPAAHPSIIAAGWEYGISVSENLPSPVASWMPNQDPPAEAMPLLERVEP
jgi:hypothetical protein